LQENLKGILQNYKGKIYADKKKENKKRKQKTKNRMQDHNLI